MHRLNVLSEHMLSGAPLKLTTEVRDALSRGRPVVALESTIISHGMPYPKNVETAKAVEEVIRKEGAVPATIAILHGVIRVGLTDSELDLLGKTGPDVMKCSRRDLAYVVATKKHGATTVSGTMAVANMVGIQVFVTGGCGGVHRGASETFDISADLTELSRTPVAVVCAGIKSILDIPKTLEYLETAGVPVFTVGSPDFPSFFTRKSGEKSQLTGTIDEAADLVSCQKRLALKTGMLIACPIPEQDEAEVSSIKEIIDQSLVDAAEQGITGKDSTPFLLARINERSGGKSLEANIKLVLNNAKIGAQIAIKVSAKPVSSEQ
eukprot:TRINITY_DN8269_c0_g1_i1.p1 TRINITY_DN8269_c0_g1~~TRINITY_DN8269_c0_g1_i1.p1  ORF type:complete len:344 (+),score=67.45 TRINITY_DN8269_c0_g1_i1:69-1034(+)